jgi:hypothetical protein
MKSKTTDWQWFKDSLGGTYYRLENGILQAMVNPEDHDTGIVDVDLFHGCSSQQLTLDCRRIKDILSA